MWVCGRGVFVNAGGPHISFGLGFPLGLALSYVAQCAVTTALPGCNAQSSVCGSHGILRRLAMTDSLGSSVMYPSSQPPVSLLPHQTMPVATGNYASMPLSTPVDSGYTVRTQSLVHELREERDLRIMELVDKKVRDVSGIASPEYARQVAQINKDICERLQVLTIYVQQEGLTRVFAHILKGYRAPSRSRSPARRRHPGDDGQDLEAA